jgi:hypothetical protein
VSYTSLLRSTPAARCRAAVRAGTLAALTSAPMLAATAALADSSNHTYQGEDSGPGLTVIQTLGIFVGIPLAAFLLIAFLVLLPGWVKGDRNRKEVGWSGSDGQGKGADARDSAEQETVAAGSPGATGGASGSW